MKFGNLFEFHKIPEWYNHYLDYKKFVAQIESHQQMVKSKELSKLNGVFFMTEDKRILDVPLFEQLPLDMQPDEALTFGSSDHPLRTDPDFSIDSSRKM